VCSLPAASRRLKIDHPVGGVPGKFPRDRRRDGVDNAFRANALLVSVQIIQSGRETWLGDAAATTRSISTVLQPGTMEEAAP
jgi:hypothetical protein